MNGVEFEVGSIFGEKGDSLKINIKSGIWKDFAGVEKGNDLISLFAAAWQIKNGEAAKRLEERLALQTICQPIVSTTKRKENLSKEKEKKRDAILSECVPITKESPAITYLKSRGIKKIYPSVFAVRPTKSGVALVCKLTNDVGEYTAVQSIYLTNDGKKADVKIVKRTNGDLIGSAIRLPSTVGDSSALLVTEGIEDALSLWQTTGFETWATLS